jgi:nucleoside-triphosphatase THEP1
MQNITIEISGNNGSGKTTTAFILKHVLEEYGFKVNVLEKFRVKNIEQCFNIKNIDRDRQIFNIDVK